MKCPAAASLILLFPLLFVPIGFVAAEPSPKLDLVSAVQYAIERSPDLGIARKNREISALDEKNALSLFFPSLDLSADHGVQGSSPPNGLGRFSSALSLSLTESLYDNGETYSRYRIAQINHELGELGFLSRRDRLSLDVSGEFYRYSLSSKLVEVRERQFEILKKQFSFMETNYRQGLKTRQDYLRLKAALQRAEIDLLTARNSVDQSAAELRRLIGVPVNAPQAEAPAFLAVEPQAMALQLPKAPPPLSRTYEYRQSDLQTEIEKYNERLVRRKYWPQLFATSAVSYQNSNYLGSSQAFGATDSLTWNALLGVRFNLWDWGIRRRNVEVAEYRRLIQEDTQTQGNQSINADLTKLMLNLQQLKADYALSEELLTLSQQSYDYLDQQYRLGKITYLDLITGLNDLLDAKIRFYSAYFDLQQSLARYRYYEGTLYGSLIGAKTDVH